MKRDYRDRTQVAPFWDAYLARLSELEAAGRYPYNDDFRGHIGADGREDEDFLIYMCQKERHIRDTESKVADRLAAGFVPLTGDHEEGKYAAVAEYAFYHDESGFREYRDVRLVRRHGHLIVLPRRARTRGYLLTGSVLVKAAS